MIEKLLELSYEDKDIKEKIIKISCEIRIDSTETECVPLFMISLFNELENQGHKPKFTIIN